MAAAFDGRADGFDGFAMSAAVRLARACMQLRHARRASPRYAHARTWRAVAHPKGAASRSHGHAAHTWPIHALAVVHPKGAAPLVSEMVR